jgi:CheY-like chemotaxis protein
MAHSHVLLVDDSDAVLDFERAALTEWCTCSVARNGAEAMEHLARVVPEAIVLDLSMPVMSGDEVLERLRQHPRLRRIPVVVVSSEHQRGERSLSRGATAFLPKPFRAEALLTVVLAAIEEARRAASAEGMVVLPIEVGPLRLALNLPDVRSVANQPETVPLPGAEGALSRYFELQGKPVVVLDVASRMGVSYRTGVADRMVVVVQQGGMLLGASVDAVDNPEEVAAGDVTRRELLGGLASQPQMDWLTGMVRTPHGPLVVLDVAALFKGASLEAVAAVIEQLEQRAAS